MTKLLYAASAAAILTVAGHLPAMAQSSASGMNAPMITCRDISTMDRDMARSVVFYVSGFQAASGSLQNQASSGTGTSTTGTTMDTTGTSSSTTGSTAADSGSGTTDSTASSGSTTADSGSGSTDTSGASGSTSADAGSSSDVTGSTSSAGGTSSGTSDTSGASGASGGASSAVMAQLPGFSSIDIDRIMSECANSPDRQLSEMIGQGASGIGTTTP